MHAAWSSTPTGAVAGELAVEAGEGVRCRGRVPVRSGLGVGQRRDRPQPRQPLLGRLGRRDRTKAVVAAYESGSVVPRADPR
jgi:hypothetical protein